MSNESTTPPEEDRVESTELASTDATDSSHQAADRIGPYRLLQKIGQGGMGEVWLAEQQEPIRRRVALKLIKLGMDTKQVLARFEAERQALAVMNHPNVARVIDAGSTEQGRPYFTMEYVKGEPITKYCDRHRLTTKERLELFMQVCEGVQHAHQKGIIHRDIKPSNVLVAIDGDKPTPKIIDFGVAKATDHRLTEQTLFTQMGALIGTPEYMSPEQAEMTVLDIDTRTDVYSLGVLLYELLAGALPFDSGELRRAGFDEIRRKIREDEPLKPSTRLTTLGDDSSKAAKRRRTDAATLQRQLRGDLDWITMKALEKDRTRRYVSAAQVASDIQLHLHSEPVSAGPPGVGYRLKKLLFKHKAFAGGIAAVATTLIFGFIVSTSLYVRAERALELAHERDKEARHQAYVANLIAAKTSLDAGEVSDAKRRLFACDASHRGWEWRHLFATVDESVAQTTVQQNIDHLSWSPDGRILAAQTVDGTLYTFDSENLRPLTSRAGRRLNDVTVSSVSPFFEITRASQGGVFTQTSPPALVGPPVAFGPDGAWIASGSWRADVDVWDPRTGQVITTGIRHEGLITSMVTSPENALLFTASIDGTVRLWEPTTGRRVATLRGDDRPVTALVISPDGSRLASVSDDGLCKVWDVASRALLATLEQNSERQKLGRYYTQLIFSNDGAYLAGERDQKLLFWDASTGDLLAVEDSGRGWHYAIAFRPNSLELLDVINSPTATGRHLRSIDPMTGSVTEDTLLADLNSVEVKFDDDATTLATISRRTIQLWDTATGIPTRTLSADHWFDRLTFSPDQERIASTSIDSTLRIWDLRRPTPSGLLRLPEPTLQSGGFSLVSVLDSVGSRHAAVWETLQLETVAELSEIQSAETSGQLPLSAHLGYQRKVICLAMHPTTSRIAAGQQYGPVMVWDVDSNELIWQTDFRGANNDVRSIAYDSSGERLLAGFDDGVARLYDAGDGALLAEFEQRQGAVTAVLLGSGGKTAILGSWSGSIAVRDSRSAELLHEFVGHSDPVLALATSRNERLLASASYRTARIWRLDEETPSVVLRGHDSRVNGIAFSPDDQRVATGSDDGSVRIWEPDTGELMLTLRSQNDGVSNVAWSEDGTRIIAAYRDGALRYWAAPTTGSVISK